MIELANWRRLKRHPLSEAFGDMDDAEFESMVADMRQHGFDERKRITIYQGQILDGWNRQRAAVVTHQTPSYHEYKGDDPLGFVVRENINRRHLEPSQRALIAARLVTTHHGGDRKTDQVTNLSLDQAATRLKVHPNSVRSGRAVLEHGAQKLQEAVSDGTVSVSDGAGIVGAPKEDQKKAVKAVRSGEAKTVREAISKFDAADEEEPADEPTIEDEIKTKNSIIETFCRQLMKLVAEGMPNDVWLDDMGRRDAALQKFKDGCAILRSAKCHAPCPNCNGDGCAKCNKVGRVPKLVHDQLV